MPCSSRAARNNNHPDDVARMTESLRRVFCLLAALLPVLNIGDAQAADVAGTKTLDGYLGAGVIHMSRYTGGAAYETDPIPLAMIEYKGTAYIHFDRAGIRLWNSADRKMALGIAAEPRFGYHAEDGARLAGMSTRRDAIEGGAAFEWELPQLALSAAWLSDWSRASGGQSFRLSLNHQLADNATWDLSAYADFDYADARVVQYYFGVRADEATAARPAYRPGATLISALGFSGAYLFDRRYALLFGGELSRLGAAAAASPIVQRRTDSMGYVGLGLAF